MKYQADNKYITERYHTTVICRYISVCSSVVMEPHNSLIANGNILDN